MSEKRYTVYVTDHKNMVDEMSTDELNAALQHGRQLIHCLPHTQMKLYDRKLNTFDLRKIERAVILEEREEQERLKRWEKTFGKKKKKRKYR